MAQFVPEDIALFLDFDGTLAPIVARPELARLPDEVAGSLLRLRERCGGALAILSGRPLAELDRLLGPLSPLPAAGSHGAERRSRDGALHAGGEGGQSALESAHQALDRLARREGLLLERKPGAVSLHFRGRDDLERDCYALATRLAGETPALRALKGHKVAEIALAGFDKGRALRAFMTEAPFAGRRPVAAGDDVTDEDAIRAAQALGGVGVRIGTADSAARLRFDDIRGFHRWLDELSRGQATLTRRNG